MGNHAQNGLTRSVPPPMNDFRFDKGRVLSFTDAVFSIAMTLLVLEISVPSYRSVVDEGTWGSLGELIPSFIGMVVSFFVTALYWIAHLRVMRYVSDFDSRLLWLNIFELFFIVLMPFSTAFYVGGVQLTGPFVFYCATLSGIGLFHFLIVSHVIRKEGGKTGLTPLLGRWMKLNALNSFSIWVLAGGLAFVLPNTSRFIFLLIFLFQAIINRYFRKRHRQQSA